MRYSLVQLVECLNNGMSDSRKSPNYVPERGDVENSLDMDLGTLSKIKYKLGKSLITSLNPSKFEGGGTNIGKNK